MRFIPLILCFLMLAGICTAQRRQYGVYSSEWNAFEPVFVLNPDSTFRYYADHVMVPDTTRYPDNPRVISIHGVLVTDSTYGRYELIRDTIVFHYATPELPSYEAGPNSRYALLIWKGKRLYHMHQRRIGEFRREHYLSRKRRLEKPFHYQWR